MRIWKWVSKKGRVSTGFQLKHCTNLRCRSDLSSIWNSRKISAFFARCSGRDLNPGQRLSSFAVSGEISLIPSDGERPLCFSGKFRCFQRNQGRTTPPEQCDTSWCSENIFGCKPHVGGLYCVPACVDRKLCSLLCDLGSQIFDYASQLFGCLIADSFRTGLFYDPVNCGKTKFCLGQLPTKSTAARRTYFNF